MPHVVIDAAIDLRAYAERFEHLHLAGTRDVLKTDALYLERSGRALLIQALAVEAGRTQTFYVRVSAQDRGSVSVRIDPLSKPERSEGVKRIVAEIGADLLARSPGARIRTTNLVLPSSTGAQGPKAPSDAGKSSSTSATEASPEESSTE